MLTGGGSQPCFEWMVGQFGSSLKCAVNALADLDAAGVAFVSVPNNLDLRNPSGRLMFQVMVPWQSSNGH
jgi:hypothetical protein